MLQSKNQLFVGLMSGTSGDGIDAAIVDFSSATPKVLRTLQHNFDTPTRERIKQLAQPGANELDTYGELDIELGQRFAQAVIDLLADANISADEVVAIGSHGQTVRHRPRFNYPFTLQIGDPNVIAQQTGITTVADFRRRDMAAGGQGAPLTPAFHQSFFRSDQQSRCIINIGGISNITYLPTNGDCIGFDCGPGNTLMDYWVYTQRQQAYDQQGEWASSGIINQELLLHLLDHPFFEHAIPKSTGPEDFSPQWLNKVLKAHNDVSPVDVQTTLTELTAYSIASATKLHLDAQNYTEIYLCGGGNANTYLVSRLKYHLPQCKIGATDTLGIEADWVEAVAFAWLAMRTIEGLAGNLTGATGAREEVVLGGIFQA
ncbi:MAG: anhydro-N-acetylmuramic acid kinase [Alteromonadaceae bacterium]|nr:MAG: anhydro-N-acetylmuramic acid kinase [Alteromonadaceae bacterium]